MNLPVPKLEFEAIHFVHQPNRSFFFVYTYAMRVEDWHAINVLIKSISTILSIFKLLILLGKKIYMSRIRRHPPAQKSVY